MLRVPVASVWLGGIPRIPVLTSNVSLKQLKDSIGDQSESFTVREMTHSIKYKSLIPSMKKHGETFRFLRSIAKKRIRAESSSSVSTDNTRPRGVFAVRHRNAYRRLHHTARRRRCPTAISRAITRKSTRSAATARMGSRMQKAEDRPQITCD